LLPQIFHTTAILKILFASLIFSSAYFFTGCNGSQNRSQSYIGESRSDYRWEESDTTLRLIRDTNLIWQYNFNTRKGKPFFHPLKVNGVTLSCESPADHTWHLGLWFSWKFINGLNYWEYKNGYASEITGYRSEGVTEIESIRIIKQKTCAAEINLDILYHPEGQAPVMKENRKINISPPLPDGSYYIDYELVFQAINQDVLLDRTPIAGEPGGQSWGGYSGLSIRFSQDFTRSATLIPEDSLSRQNSNFIYMGFETDRDGKSGLSIFQHPDFKTPTTSWYITNNPEVPFIYYSPAVIFDHNILLEREQQLHLKYRVWTLSGDVDEKLLKEKYEQYVSR
jgi:hypothetical protein